MTKEESKKYLDIAVEGNMDNMFVFGRRFGAIEYKQFISNVLDGVDKADEQMGNKLGGTQAIRLAIKSRII